jgi:hypothetical protein
MWRDSEVPAACGLTDVSGVSFIDLAPCTACVAKVSVAPTTTSQYAPRALVKALFIIDLPSVFLSFVGDLFSELHGSR